MPGWFPKLRRKQADETTSKEEDMERAGFKWISQADMLNERVSAEDQFWDNIKKKREGDNGKKPTEEEWQDLIVEEAAQLYYKAGLPWLRAGEGKKTRRAIATWNKLYAQHLENRRWGYNLDNTRYLLMKGALSLLGFSYRTPDVVAEAVFIVKGVPSRGPVGRADVERSDIEE